MKDVYPEKTGTLCARMSRGFNGQDAVGLTVVIKILRGGGIAATLDASYYKGSGSRNGKEREVVAVRMDNEQEKETEGQAETDARIYPRLQITSKINRSNPKNGDPAPTLAASNRDILVSKKRKRKYIVRRLTPLECCRLQGFPDWWMDGVEGSDSAKYKAWGNSIAIPCADDVLGRIARELRETKKDE